MRDGSLQDDSDSGSGLISKTRKNPARVADSVTCRKRGPTTCPSFFSNCVVLPAVVRPR